MGHLLLVIIYGKCHHTALQNLCQKSTLRELYALVQNRIAIQTIDALTSSYVFALVISLSHEPTIFFGSSSPDETL